MRKWTSGVAWFFLVMLVVLLLSIGIDPYLTLGSSVPVLLLNALVPMLLVTLIWGLTGRPFLSIFLGLVLIALAVIVDHVKWRFLHTNLVYADIRIVPTLLLEPKLVLGFVTAPVWKIVLDAILAVGIIVALAMLPWGKCANWRMRVALVALGSVGFAFALGGRSPAIVSSMHWEVFSQPVGASEVGVLGNVLLGLRTSTDVNPPVDVAQANAFRNAPEVRAEQQAGQAVATNLKPDIIVIQSESLFEPSELCDMPSTPVLKNIVNGGPGPVGKLLVPVFGGRTLQTEFEVQSGAPVDYFGTLFAYYDLVDHPIEAMPRQLERLGYRTLAIHPNLRGFWRRGYALPRLGFATFVDGDAFVPGDMSTRGHVSDDALMRAIVSELDASSAPSYILAITMDNHGPWGNAAPDPAVESMIPAGLHGDARAQFADYLSRAIVADRSWKTLTDALAARKRPAIAVIFGDHLPGLAPVYEHLCFKDGKPPTSNWPPLQVWSNFPIPPLPSSIKSYLLGGWLTRAAQLKGGSVMQHHASAAAIATDPAVPEARKQALEHDYAEVAAQTVYASPKPLADGEPLTFMDGSNSLHFASQHVVDVPGAIPLDVSSGAVALLAKGHSQSTIDLALNDQVGSATIRLYHPPAQNGGSADGVAHVVISGDGRTLLNTMVTPTSVNLATLDTSGVKRLRIQSEVVKPYASDGPLLKFAQMGCYDAQCAESHLPAGTRPLATLETTTDMLSMDLTTDYILQHEEKRRDGLAPITKIWSSALYIVPRQGEDSFLQIDATNVKSMTIQPRMKTMDQACKAIPGAGTVDFIVSADGKPLQRVHVAPGYAGELKIDLHHARKVRFSVDSDGDSSCDWFYVQFPVLTLYKTQSTSWWQFW